MADQPQFDEAALRDYAKAFARAAVDELLQKADQEAASKPARQRKPAGGVGGKSRPKQSATR